MKKNHENDRTSRPLSSLKTLSPYALDPTVKPERALTLRVHVPKLHILWPQSTYTGTTMNKAKV